MALPVFAIWCTWHELVGFIWLMWLETISTNTMCTVRFTFAGSYQDTSDLVSERDSNLQKYVQGSISRPTSYQQNVGSIYLRLLALGTRERSGRSGRKRRREGIGGWGDGGSAVH